MLGAEGSGALGSSFRMVEVMAPTCEHVACQRSRDQQIGFEPWQDLVRPIAAGRRRIAREYRALRARRRSPRSPLTESLPGDGLTWFGTNGRELTGEEASDPGLSAFAALMRFASPREDPEPGLEQPLLALLRFA
jgi:hypothetical protein